MLHQEKLDILSAVLKSRPEGTPVKIAKKTVSHVVPKGEKENSFARLDISNLNEIIEINAAEKTCTAEPGVTFSDLVRATLEYHLVPMTVPELKDITIGGAVSGCSVESMSYKYGGFHDSCMEYEVLLPSGQTINCIRNGENDDIFQMMHGTFGTLGVITKLKFKLVPAKPFVHLKHYVYQNLDEYMKAIADVYRIGGTDFMDGIIHGPNTFVLCLGIFTDTAPYKNNYEWTKIYYKSTLERNEDYLSTYDYFFRYDAGCHWISKNYGLDNPLIRLLFGKFFLPSTKMLQIARKTTGLFGQKKRPDFIQDIFIPFSKWSDFWQFYMKEFNAFPLWVVPYRIKELYPWINPNHVANVTSLALPDLYIDLAIYGMKQKGKKDYYRVMEEELLQLPGMKTLISYNSLSKEEFSSMWNYEGWKAIKQKTDPQNSFGDLYEKTIGKKSA